MKSPRGPRQSARQPVSIVLMATISHAAGEGSGHIAPFLRLTKDFVASHIRIPAKHMVLILEGFTKALLNQGHAILPLFAFGAQQVRSSHQANVYLLALS